MLCSPSKFIRGKTMATVALTVLFDGGCPMCSGEIAHYRKLTSLKPIHWSDITQDDQMLRRFGVGREAAMAEFHVLDEAGNLHKGADGFVLLWQALPYYRWLARTCQALRLLPVMRWAYSRFAGWHYRRRCAAGVCG
jgi:predicted DCC family thiol-disulfide oxidoreductase YuxK